MVNIRVNGLGYSLVEVLVATGILMILIASVASISQTSLLAFGEGKVRAIAIQLAQDKIEIAHNLTYAQVGTVGGIPAGSLIQSENVSKLGSIFVVKTSVYYIDDPYDGLAPADLNANDYKRVRVDVSWAGAFSSTTPVVLMTDMSPSLVETAVGQGTLSISVVDANGLPLQNAEVRVVANAVSPNVDLTTYSDVFGKVLLPGAMTCNACYQISATKNGYSTDRTYGTNEVTNPAKPHLSILEGQISEVSLLIDETSMLTVKATRPASSGYSPFSGVQLTLRGSKTIGLDSNGEPVYKYKQNFTSGGDGSAVISSLETDSYTILVPTGSSIDMAGSWPYLPISIDPGEHPLETVIVTSASQNSLLVRLLDNSQAPIASAAVEIRSNTIVATASTGLLNQGDYSQVFFKDLPSELFSILAMSPSFEDATSSATISGDIIDTIIMNLK